MAIAFEGILPHDAWARAEWGLSCRAAPCGAAVPGLLFESGPRPARAAREAILDAEVLAGGSTHRVKPHEMRYYYLAFIQAMGSSYYDTAAGESCHKWGKRKAARACRTTPRDHRL